MDGQPPQQCITIDGLELMYAIQHGYDDHREQELVFENVIFEHNTLHHGYHTTGFDISNGWNDTFRHFVFCHNRDYDDHQGTAPDLGALESPHSTD